SFDPHDVIGDNSIHPREPPTTPIALPRAQASVVVHLLRQRPLRRRWLGVGADAVARAVHQPARRGGHRRRATPLAARLAPPARPRHRRHPTTLHCLRPAVPWSPPPDPRSLSAAPGWRTSWPGASWCSPCGGSRRAPGRDPGRALAVRRAAAATDRGTDRAAPDRCDRERDLPGLTRVTEPRSPR